MFKIGDFSRIGRVSMRLLRYYDELGLLQPAHTDAHNGYRFYSAAQLPRLNRILVLRDLGLTLDQIARCLERDVSSDELRGMLLMRRTEIEQAHAQQALQLRLLESRIAMLDADAEEREDDVVIRAEPDRQYLSLRGVYDSFDSAAATVLQLYREIPPQVRQAKLGPLIGISHSPEFEPDELDVELGFAIEQAPVRAPKLNGQALTLRTLPGHARMAACVRVGSPAKSHQTTARIARYLEASGFHLAGPNREIFLQPLQPNRLDEAVVEMAFPVELR